MAGEIEARVRAMIRASDSPTEVAAALQASLRYSIRLHTAMARDDYLALGATKIGGRRGPPPDMSWPEWRGSPLNFLAQTELADIAAYDPDGELPHEGMPPSSSTTRIGPHPDVMRKARSPKCCMCPKESHSIV
jgi:hypothetical protein